MEVSERVWLEVGYTYTIIHPLSSVDVGDSVYYKGYVISSFDSSVVFHLFELDNGSTIRLARRVVEDTIRETHKT